MASVKPYYLKHEEGNESSKKKALRYMVQYRTPDRQLTKKRGFKRKGDAQKFADEIERTKDLGTFIHPQAGRTTVGEIFELWRPSQDALMPRTRRTNMGKLASKQNHRTRCQTMGVQPASRRQKAGYHFARHSRTSRNLRYGR